ncbi:hypothetical protein [Nannocystis pusilla]|uniref:hypothetical protein n=1 Tax=Nannocystis pusilla TaxID=889268 RepID=UPI003DA5C109
MMRRAEPFSRATIAEVVAKPNHGPSHPGRPAASGVAWLECSSCAPEGRPSCWLSWQLLALPGLAVACSGPGAREAILHAEQLGLVLWFTTAVLAGGSLFMPRMRVGGRRKPWPLLLLAVLHPGWWMSARSGDCGQTLILGSVMVTALTLLVAGFLLWRPRVAK